MAGKSTEECHSPFKKLQIHNSEDDVLKELIKFMNACEAVLWLASRTLVHPPWSLC